MKDAHSPYFSTETPTYKSETSQWAHTVQPEALEHTHRLFRIVYGDGQIVFRNFRIAAHPAPESAPAGEPVLLPAVVEGQWGYIDTTGRFVQGPTP